MPFTYVTRRAVRAPALVAKTPVFARRTKPGHRPVLHLKSMSLQQQLDRSAVDDISLPASDPPAQLPCWTRETS